MVDLRAVVSDAEAVVVDVHLLSRFELVVEGVAVAFVSCLWLL
jgi:hypothetical protein